MELQTKVEIKAFRPKINHTSKILMLGSCFSTNIGERLATAKFDVCINPFGVIYNPASIAGSIGLMLNNKNIDESALLKQNELFYNYAFHSSFSSTDKFAALDKMNLSKQKGYEYLKNADFIIITLGSAIAYKHKTGGEIVANCHKQQSREFEQISLSIDEIVNLLQDSIAQIVQLNPKANFIFTVSPIRYLNYGAHQNQLSKAKLLLAANTICTTTNNCNYFHSYEIMMDELRDYRFYANDMTHPSPLALDYIWEKFASVAIEDKSLKLMEEFKKLQAAKMHKPFYSNTKEHLTFLQTYYEKTRLLQEKYPYINLKEELDYFSAI